MTSAGSCDVTAAGQPAAAWTKAAYYEPRITWPRNITRHEQMLGIDVSHNSALSIGVTKERDNNVKKGKKCKN